MSIRRSFGRSSTRFYFHLYGVTDRDDVRYTIIERDEMAAYGGDVRKIHPSKVADVMVARRARVRVAANLERRNCMPARCGHRSTCASDQILRRIIPTAERTVTRGGNNH
jgi:hypothetical protein